MRNETVFNSAVLEKYFTEGAYRFQMQFGRGTFADFYDPTEEHRAILAERRSWLAHAEGQYLVTDPEGESILEEAVSVSSLPPAGIPEADYRARARWLGEHWEPDYLLLKKGAGEIRLVCGCVCFPSAWSVEEKIGRRIEEIHDVVPGLNPAIGRPIHTFLERIKPGISWTRSNWGLSRSPERNQHPSRRLPRLDATVELDEIFFRVEEQSLVGLPKTEGILFGIRIKVYPLRLFVGNDAGQMLALALKTMPEAMARYKGIASSRERIMGMLAER